MSIRRIMPDIRATDLPATRDFYCGLLGLRVGMDEEPFLLLGSPDVSSAQLTVNDNGHPGLPPGFAIDVGTPEQVDEIHRQVTERGMSIVEPLSDKPWGIRRFSVIDPGGVRVTIVAHLDE